MDGKLWVRRLNVQAGAMLIATILALSGSIMIFKGVEGHGVIDLKSSFLEGQVESGSVGVLLVFCAMFLAVATLIQDRKKKHTIHIKRGDLDIQWEGTFTTVEEMDLAERLLLEDGTGERTSPSKQTH